MHESGILMTVSRLRLISESVALHIQPQINPCNLHLL